MTTHNLADDLEGLMNQGSLVGLDDLSLLTRFREDRDSRAFALIVERHGPMVFSLCRSILPDTNDVEDAFQATFAVLARQSGRIRDPAKLPAWLHGVGRRVAVRIRRARRPGRLVTDHAAQPESASVEDRELAEVLHQEIGRLPEKYRLPVVLFYLEDLSHDQTAARLRWPVGTVRGRLARARELLRRRLDRRGVSCAIAGGPFLDRIRLTRMIVPDDLVRSTSNLATGTVSSDISLVSQGVIHAMSVTRLKWTMSTLAGLSLVLFVGSTAVRGLTSQATPEPEETRAALAAPLQEPAPKDPAKVVDQRQAKLDEEREKAEFQLDEAKISAEIMTFEIEVLRDQIRARQKNMFTIELEAQANRDPEIAKRYEEARNRLRSQRQDDFMELRDRGLRLAKLKREIARDSRVVRRDSDPGEDPVSVSERLRALETKFDRLLDAIENKP